MNWKINRELFKKVLKIFLFLIIAAVAIYFYKFAPVSVKKYEVKKGKIVAKAMGTGTLDAKIKMTISSKISGRIEKILVDQGNRVTKGQLLVTLGSKEFKLQVEVEDANLKTVESTANKLQRDLEYNQAVLNNAIINYKRYKQLISKKAISQEKFDNATEEYGMAIAKYRHAEEALIEGKNKIIEAEKMLELSKSQLEDSYIKAPFDGIITKRERDPGDIVIPGSAILSLVSTKILWIRAWVGETNLKNIKVGQPARVIFRSDPNHVYTGSVARVAIKVDSETREFIVDVNVNKLPINWAIGQRAEVYIETDTKDNVLFIPGKYIRWRDNLSGVFVDNGGHATWHFVKTGLHDGNFIEIISGLQKGNNVLNPVNLKNKLKDNTRIYVK
jgi:HlyD family secretion protein